MIVTVALDDGADAVFDVPASLMRQVSPDVEITIALTDDPKIRTVGRVRETAPQADPVTRSYRVKVGLTERPEAMRLGATVTGQATMRAPGGIELPATALTLADNKPAVWVVDPANQQVSPRPVQVQRQDSSGIVVTGGITDGDVVVIAGVHALRPGQKVRLLGTRNEPLQPDRSMNERRASIRGTRSSPNNPDPVLPRGFGLAQFSDGITFHDGDGFETTDRLAVLCYGSGFDGRLTSWRRKVRNSSKRAVASRMIAAMPIICPASSANGTIVNSTEICAPSLRIAGTERVWPSL